MARVIMVPAGGASTLVIQAGDALDVSGGGTVSANGVTTVLGAEEIRVGPFSSDVTVAVSANPGPVRCVSWSAPLLSALPKRRQIVATRGRMPIATEGGPPSNYTRFESSINVRTGPSAVSSVQILYANRYGVSNGEAGDADNYQLESAIWRTSIVHPLTFQGRKSPTIEAGTPFLASDPLGMTAIPAGSSMTLRSGAIVSSGQKIPAGGAGTAGQTGTAASTSATSQVYSGSAITTPSGGAVPSNAFVPLCVLGIPEQRHPALFIWGDSIMYGQGDNSTTDTYGHVGWVERGCALPNGTFLPFVNCSRSGERSLAYSVGYAWTRYALLEYVTHALFGASTNDLAAAVPLATLQSNVQAAWSQARRMGCRVYHTTMTPKTTGSWTTAAGQTVAAGYGSDETRGQFNAWLFQQAAAGVIDGVLDVNAVVEDPANPGKWRTDLGALTADGLHPNQAGHVLMSSVLSAAASTWSA